MNFNNFTIKSQEAVQKATEIAAAKQNQAIETSHLLKGMLMVDENVIPFLLKKLNVNLDVSLRRSTGLSMHTRKSVGGTSSFPMVPQKPCRKPPHLRRNSGMNLSPSSIFSWESFRSTTALHGCSRRTGYRKKTSKLPSPSCGKVRPFTTRTRKRPIIPWKNMPGT